MKKKIPREGDTIINKGKGKLEEETYTYLVLRFNEGGGGCTFISG